MDRRDVHVPKIAQPLLLSFMRPKAPSNLDFRYDPAQRLNVTARDGVPVVATSEGRAALKTVGQVAED